MILAAAFALVAAQTGGSVNPEPAPPPAAAPPFAVRVVPATPVPTAATPQPLICKSSIVTGSLIAKRKQCLTKAQWQYVDDVQRQQNQQMMDDQRSKQGCGGPAC